MKPERLPATLVGHASGVLLLPEVGPPVLEAVAAGARGVASWMEAGVVSFLLAAGRPATVLAVLGPLALLALVAVVGVIVWPAVLDHVPADEARPEEDGATVVHLPARRDQPSRRAA